MQLSSFFTFIIGFSNNLIWKQSSYLYIHLSLESPMTSDALDGYVITSELISWSMNIL